MKKIVSILLVVSLLVCGALCAYALAEATEPATPAAPLVDLTAVILAVLALVFDFLLAWIAKVIIPPIKEWLAARTTEKERGLIWDAICKLVDAAEQIITGPGQGARRLAYVEAGLKQRGYTVDNDMIEAAVKRMKDRLGENFGTAFTIGENDRIVAVPVKENGEPDLEITHWNVDQLRSFCLLNNIPVDGCVTKEDYMWAIERGSVDGSDACEKKDYCDLDDDGNPIPEAEEAPQSVNE